SGGRASGHKPVPLPLQPLAGAARPGATRMSENSRPRRVARVMGTSAAKGKTKRLLTCCRAKAGWMEENQEKAADSAIATSWWPSKSIKSGQQVLRAVGEVLRQRFNVTHPTIQVEVEGCDPSDMYCAM